MDIKDQYIRNFLRIIAAIVLLAYLYDIVSDKVTTGKLYLDTNDGWVIIGCVSLLLAIEAVKRFVQRKLKNKDAVK